jgi:formate dehydrogenase iron-sulfur subunit
MAEKAILFDTQRCSACRGCQVACKQWNEHEETDKTTFTGTYENPPKLSPNTWVRMRFDEVVRSNKLSWLFTRNSCMHCTDASCAIVCPVGAIVKTPEGFVHIDQEWCIGCGTCTQSCPFGIPKMNEEVGTAMKCSACTEVGLNRLTAGQEPACVKSCPPDALTYGDRETLVAEGQKKVAALKAAGKTNAYLYGETELGGLHVMYVLDDKPSVYGLPENPRVATKDVAEKWLAGLATAGVVAGLPLLWIMKRRDEMQAKKNAEGGVK